MAGLLIGAKTKGEIGRQFVQRTTQTETDGTRSTLFLLTDIYVEITPKLSDSRILVTFNCGGMVNGTCNDIAIAIKRVMSGTTTQIRYINRYGYVSDNNGWLPFPLAVDFLDETVSIPATPVLIRYALYMARGASGTVEINPDATTVLGGLHPAIITATELAPN